MSTQIFATFGPSCGQKETLKNMIEEGMTGMRLNLSHTTLSASEGYIGAYQVAAKECGVEPQILIDMQGPELRVGDLEEPLELCEGEMVLLTRSEGEGYTEACNEGDDCTEEVAGKKVIVPFVVVNYTQSGDVILLDDGKLELEVSKIRQVTNLTQGEGVLVGTSTLYAKVLRGGILKSRKSIKIKGRQIPMPVLTEHDIANIKEAKAYGVTALMQPFVLCGEDLRQVREVLKEHGGEDIRIFAKIENRIGVERLDDILPEADVIVIARGDLGNDMPLWELPAVQKQIENKCKEYNKPYIVVTQMLASMEEHPIPTRAEVSDIFHAVYHGAWGVMITGETAIGKYPVEAVRYLARTADSAVF